MDHSIIHPLYQIRYYKRIIFFERMSSTRVFGQDFSNVCGWEEAVLVPRDFNIPLLYKKDDVVNLLKSSFHSIKKQSRATNKKTTRPSHFNLQNMLPDKTHTEIWHPAMVQSAEEKLNQSNLNKLKRKMRILQEDHDRWQVGINEGVYCKKRMMSGFIKSNLQLLHQESKQSCTMRILSKSTQHCQQQNGKARPSTGVSRINSNMAQTIGQFNMERSKTIHEKSGRPSTKHRIRCSNFIHKAINININQLESLKMKKILKYLNKNK